MKKCELCEKVARMYCDSDQASLCWDCDYRVHTANFIVSKHTRTLLCHSCQSLTPWTGSGSRLGPTVSVCNACSNVNPRTENSEDDDGNDDASHDKDDDDGENQVVPLSPPPSSASTSKGSSGYFRSSSSESSRFSYDEEKKGGEGFRSWKWR